MNHLSLQLLGMLDHINPDGKPLDPRYDPLGLCQRDTARVAVILPRPLAQRTHRPLLDPVQTRRVVNPQPGKRCVTVFGIASLEDEPLALPEPVGVVLVEDGVLVPRGGVEAPGADVRLEEVGLGAGGQQEVLRVGHCEMIF